jgi:predicted  nucleic acid-binding Zn-ribbon protein
VNVKLPVSPLVGVLPALLLGGFGYLLAKKEKTMTALENALLNLIGPIIDALRAVEKERDRIREDYRKSVESEGTLRNQVDDLCKQIETLEKGDTEKRGEITTLINKLGDANDQIERLVTKARVVAASGAAAKRRRRA